eukprot:CAMPEP_0182466998 /NCGR_PEP_ID=MMETSP1319-20130603/13061_1 /TAXON_ID=172717 /ORGANISM="Bolidomonas pacifica, Strain RCC208" /LENGTH=160 /DNA_ID=CAMNT_0024667045 /DNA_START=5 /DNA_END=484 /DNA_ORIENTATION=-
MRLVTLTSSGVEPTKQRWYQSFHNFAVESDMFSRCDLPLLPDPTKPLPLGWYRTVINHPRDLEGGCGPVDDKTVIVAHGVGASTALRVAEKHKLHSVYLVAPSRMDGDEAEFAWQAVAENVKAFHGLLKGGEDEFERTLRGELGHGKWEVVEAETGWEDC